MLSPQKSLFWNASEVAGTVRRGLSKVYLKYRIARPAPLCAVVMSAILAGCSQSTDVLDGITTSSIASTRTTAAAYSGSSREHDCLARAMFFESIRSSREGLVAVGTVVMNRVDSQQYPDTVCGVVGQKNQFAPGVLTRQMNSKALPDVMAAADAVLKGERHPAVRNAHHFHQAGLTFPYRNMHYVLTAGGNAFYERRSRSQMVAAQPAKAETVAETVETQTSVMAYGDIDKAADAIGALLASQSRPTGQD